MVCCYWAFALLFLRSHVKYRETAFHPSLPTFAWVDCRVSCIHNRGTSHYALENIVFISYQNVSICVTIPMGSILQLFAPPLLQPLLNARLSPLLSRLIVAPSFQALR